MPPDPEPDALARRVAFLAEADRMKEIRRQTLCSQSLRQENDAEHSWHLCLAALVLAPDAAAPGLDLLRVLRMVIIHDLVEIDAGDTFAYDTARMKDQHEREALAADRIFGMLPGGQAAEFRALWDEFEARATPEARFAAALDRFQPMLQNCMTRGASWRGHGITADRVLARNAHIAAGIPALWDYALAMVGRAVAAGHLEPGPDGPPPAPAAPVGGPYAPAP